MRIQEIAAQAGYPDLGVDGWLSCAACGERYPIIGGTPRMLDAAGRSRLGETYPEAAITLPQRGADLRVDSASLQERTAESFAYEWSHFGGHRAEWRKNFIDYMQPHPPEFFRDKLVLDVGAGSGRHSVQAAALGAQVIALDVGRSIDVARRNLPPEVLTVQGDAECLPFSRECFDIVMSIGVLHHLENTEAALRALVPFVKPGGRLHIYLYWVPEIRWHRIVLRVVGAMRRFTVQMPFGLLRQLCYPLSAGLWVGIVVPHRLLRNRRHLQRFANALPLKVYADYPFAVLVNDQFDRFSAPKEQRFSRAQVEVMLERAGLDQVVVLPNHGWVGDGRRSTTVQAASGQGVSLGRHGEQ